jgi:hypothetical protein
MNRLYYMTSINVNEMDTEITTFARALDPVEALTWLAHTAGDASLMFTSSSMGLLAEILMSATD